MKLGMRYRLSAAFLAVGILMTHSATAQSAKNSDVKITIQDVTVEDLVYTPYYQVETEQKHFQGSAQRWMRLGVYFTTEGQWIDEIDVTQMAYINGDTDEKSLILSEKVHYINLEPGDHHVYVYLHPSYMKRYELESFDLDSAAIISIGNQQVASMETVRHAEKGWSLSADGSKTRGYLLNHAETPFWFINYDFKELIKRTDRPTE